jgi:response regulator RpfG family c-di-GMP phosphodiesterase
MHEFRFIISSEDKQNLKILSNVLNKLYPDSSLTQFDDGLEAWKNIEKYDYFTVFITSFNTQGLNAFQVQKKIHESGKVNKTYSIFISEKQDKEFNIKTITQGFDDYMSTPFALDEIISKLKSATRAIKLTYELNQEKKSIFTLKKELLEFRDRTFDIIKTLQKTRFPDSDKLNARLKDASVFIGRELNVEEGELKDIELAAELCLINRMFLSDAVLRNPLMKDGHPASELVPQAQNFASNLLAKVWGADNISKIVNHLYENFDGTGVPRGDRGWQIPLGSRILRVLLDFEDLIVFKKIPQVKALEEIDHDRSRVYDPTVICLFDQFLGYSNNREKRIEVKDLIVGKVVSRNIFTTSGNKIVGAGTTITQEKLDRLLNIIDSDPILGHIYIEV